ncbi:hypothetical protein HB976_11715 [Yersinia mollaretii]|nr:hypothetical protein [Yersinia mollaretii]MDA5535500.1 hypothetical protein [Yersinia mollaretii]NIL03619.1 hypothetical protein [Yersinia mollaretii]
MKKHLLSIMLLSSITSSFAQAEEFQEFSVKGKIKPVACDILVTTPKIELPVITANAFKEAESKIAEDIQYKFSVECEADNAISITFSDGQPGTAFGSDPDRFGLGKVTGKDNKEIPVGSWKVKLTELTAETTKDGIISNEMLSRIYRNAIDKRDWAGIHKDAYLYVDHEISINQGTVLNTNQQIKTIKKLSGTLTGEIFGAPRANLPLSEQMPISGKITMSINYL